jgi:hypothetical protein
MHRILHRINTREELIKCPHDLGVEVDIRSDGEILILHHDPFSDGENFEDWLAVFNHGTLILNVKEDGLEGLLIQLMKKNNIEHFFFLDQSFPYLVKTFLAGESRSAIRVSEFENIDTAMTLAGKVDWVWVDCFTRFPLTAESAYRLQREGAFKLCFVSPELQGRMDREGVLTFRDNIEALGIKGDAVCTKYPDLWG